MTPDISEKIRVKQELIAYHQRDIHGRYAEIERLRREIEELETDEGNE